MWNGKHIGVNSDNNIVLTEGEEDQASWRWAGNTLVNKKNKQVIDIFGGDKSNGKL